MITLQSLQLAVAAVSPPLLVFFHQQPYAGMITLQSLQLAVAAVSPAVVGVFSPTTYKQERRPAYSFIFSIIPVVLNPATVGTITTLPP